MVISIRRYHRHHQNENRFSSYIQKQLKWIGSVRDQALDPKLYRIKFQVHQSGPTSVHRAEHVARCQQIQHPVVIKMIDLEREEPLESIIHEVRTLTKLRHNNVIPLLASFTANRHYLWNVMVEAEYGSVDQWSKPNGLPEMAIAFIIKDVLTALNYLHKRGIIHRAVCGSHILVNANGNCMLTGLKYSTTVIQKGRWQRAIHDFPKNSPQILNHLAPEILEQNLLGYNSKSDIYSLGIVCCELANGCVPFEDIVFTEMLLDKLTGNFPRPLDSTCEEILNFPTNDQDLSPEIREKYNQYKNRIFSASFHKFTVDKCLNFDSCSRPKASDLLEDSFIKQTKKSHHGLIKLLQQQQTATSRPPNVIVNFGGSSSSSSSDCNQNDQERLQPEEEDEEFDPKMKKTFMDLNIGGGNSAAAPDSEWIF